MRSRKVFRLLFFFLSFLLFYVNASAAVEKDLFDVCLKITSVL